MIRLTRRNIRCKTCSKFKFVVQNENYVLPRCAQSFYICEWDMENKANVQKNNNIWEENLTKYIWLDKRSFKFLWEQRTGVEIGETFADVKIEKLERNTWAGRLKKIGRFREATKFIPNGKKSLERPIQRSIGTALRTLRVINGE